MSRFRLAFALALLAASNAAAQGHQSSLCWLRTGPLERCRAFVVTEAALEFPMFGTGATDRSDVRPTLSIGVMKNTSATRAIGVVIGHDLEVGWQHAPTRAEVRARDWRNHYALDASAGLFKSTPIGVNSIGVTGALGVDWKYIGGETRLDVYRGGGSTRAVGYLGAKATSAGAPVAIVVVVGTIIAFVVSTGAGY